MTTPYVKVVSTLTTPEDREGATATTILNAKHPDYTEALTHAETCAAVDALYDPTYVKRFPAVERKFADEPIPLQIFGLVSFVPAQGASANSKGVFGMMKLRGNFATLGEAELHAQTLIRKTDSYHKIYTTHVGRPFPITVSSEFSKDIDEVQLNKEVVETYSADVKAKREKEKKDMEEIQEREQRLLRGEHKEEMEDPKEYYTMIQNKRAQLIWTYKSTEEKMAEMRKAIINTRTEIAEMDEKDPDLRNGYFKRYMDARRASHLSNEEHANNWIKFLAEDVELPFLQGGNVAKVADVFDFIVQRESAEFARVKAGEYLVEHKENREVLTLLGELAGFVCDTYETKITDCIGLSNKLLLCTCKLMKLITV